MPTLATTLPAKTTKDIALYVAPSLAVIRRTDGEEQAIKKVISLILDVNNALNIQRKMSMAQMTMAAQLIFEDYYYLRMHEIAFVFKNAIKGVYGPFYESLDITKIFAWLNEYAKEREEIYWDKALREHYNQKESNDAKRSN